MISVASIGTQKWSFEDVCEELFHPDAGLQGLVGVFVAFLGRLNGFLRSFFLFFLGGQEVWAGFLDVISSTPNDWYVYR